MSYNEKGEGGARAFGVYGVQTPLFLKNFEKTKKFVCCVMSFCP